MNRSVLAAVLLSFFFLLFGCGGEDGPVGPPGKPGSPQPIKVLLAGAENELALLEMVIVAYRRSLFPLGSEIHTVSLLDSLPPLSVFRKYDAVMCWSLSAPQLPEVLGDILADYVDSGGGLVIGQFAYSPKGPLGGRIMSPGYSPFKAGPASSILGNRQLDFRSLATPFHPIFNGTDVLDLHYHGQPDMSSPELDGTAILIAKDTDGANAAAINTKGNIIGLNIYAGWWYRDGDYDYPARLMANALLFVSGKL